MAPVMNNYYYEMMPNGDMFIVPIVRSLQEVLAERTQIAEFFRTGPNAQVLGGVCDMIKADIVFENKTISLRNIKIPLSLELQHKIDVYNTITAEEILAEYKKKRDKSQMRRLMRNIKKGPCRSTDRTEVS